MYIYILIFKERDNTLPVFMSQCQREELINKVKKRADIISYLIKII